MVPASSFSSPAQTNTAACQPSTLDAARLPLGTESLPLAGPLADEPPIRIEALHAMKYCERLFYFQEVEHISVPHANVYAGRRLHDNQVPEDDITPEKQSFQVASEAWGLTGKADAVRKRDGQWIVYEHKKGRCRREHPENENAGKKRSSRKSSSGTPAP